MLPEQWADLSKSNISRVKDVKHSSTSAFTSVFLWNSRPSCGNLQYIKVLTEQGFSNFIGAGTPHGADTSPRTPHKHIALAIYKVTCFLTFFSTYDNFTISSNKVQAHICEPIL